MPLRKQSADTWKPTVRRLNFPKLSVELCRRGCESCGGRTLLTPPVA